MARKRTARPGRAAAAARGTARGTPAAPRGTGEIPPDQLTARAKAGDRESFLALVRFHSTFNPLPLSPDVLQQASLEEDDARRVLGRLKRKEDSLLRPFPAINMVFWGEEWVQEALSRFMWRKRGERVVPDDRFLARLWDASREGALLQLKIYKRMSVAASAWVRVKYPHFANIGLTDAQMLKIARAEGCRFGEEAFRSAVRRFRRSGDPAGCDGSIDPR